MGPSSSPERIPLVVGERIDARAVRSPPAPRAPPAVSRHHFRNIRPPGDETRPRRRIDDVRLTPLPRLLPSPRRRSARLSASGVEDGPSPARRAPRSACLARSRSPPSRPSRACPPSVRPSRSSARALPTTTRAPRASAPSLATRVFTPSTCSCGPPSTFAATTCATPDENVLRAKTTTAEFIYPQWLRAPLLSDPRRVADPTDAHLMLMTDSMVDVSPFIAKFVWHATHPEKTPDSWDRLDEWWRSVVTATRRAANSSPRRRNASRRSATRSRTPARPSRGGRTSFLPSGCSRATTWRPSCDCARRFGRRRTTAR